MNIRVDNFHGIQPRVHPTLLADGMAVTAHNCRLKNGKLVPLRKSSIARDIMIHMENGLTSVADAKSLYAWKHTQTDGTVMTDFLAFPGIVDFAEGNIADDDYDRLFVTGQTGVTFTDENGVDRYDAPAVYFYSRSSNAIFRRTFCKTVLDAPTVSTTGTLSDGKTVYYVQFFVSWVDANGYESGLSAPSKTGGKTAPIALNNGMSVSFGAMQNVPQDARKIYVYATAAGTSENTDGIQFFVERTVAEATEPGGFSAAFVPDRLGEAEPGIESPPVDLSGIQFVAGGFYAGFSRSSPHTVMFSDIGTVTSWPIAYRYDVKDNIVALATTSNSVFALTDGYPWVLSGTAPESMTVAKLAGAAACLSARGVCVLRNSVYFVSHEGLMAIVNDASAGTVCVNVTSKAFTKEQWQAKNPEKCVMEHHDGALYLFFNDVKDRKPGLVIDLSEGADAITTHDEPARCLCRDDRNDRLYFVRGMITGGGE